jgi:Vam6/Vps39-like protein vacuolar protein sorting-associated protein 39
LFPTSSSRNVEPCISIVDSKYFAVAKDEFVITVNPEASFSVEDKNDFEIVKAIKDMGSASIMDTDNTKQSQTISWSEPVQMLGK